MVNLHLRKVLSLQTIILLSVISVSFFFLAWPLVGLTPFIFLALAPLVIVARNREIKYNYKMFIIWLSFIISNIAISFWITKLSVVGAIVYWVVSATLQTLPFLFLLSKTSSYIAFISFWILLEGLQLHSEFSFPLFILGNALSGLPALIQWYQITGVLGGSLWVLLVNLLVAEAIGLGLRKAALAIVPVLLLPIVSNFIFSTKKSYKNLNVLIGHINVNCYTEKFAQTSDELLAKYVKITKTKLTNNTDLILWPETAVTDFGWLEDIPTKNRTLNSLIDSLKIYPNTTLITGGILYEKAPFNAPSSSYSEEMGYSFYTYNSAIGLDFENQNISIRHKEKLVPVEEYQPYPFLTKYLSFIYSSLSGLKFNKKILGNSMFEIKQSRILPLICFEILYGDFVNKKSLKANGIVLLMNEGWYDNLWASGQFLAITKIRAIEQQKNIAIASNRGNSGFVHPDGTFETTNRHKAEAITGLLGLNKTRTFYAQFGDFIIRFAAISFILSTILIIKQKFSTS